MTAGYIIGTPTGSVPRKLMESFRALRQLHHFFLGFGKLAI
jgi:hypothetical protein